MPTWKASASSTQNGHLPEYAIDGDPTTRWCPGDGNPGHAWQVDLGGPQDLEGVKIIWQTAHLYQYVVEGSSDGHTWVMLSDQSQRSEAQQEHSLALNGKGTRYVRITTTGLPEGLWGTFGEVEINGMPGEANPPSTAPGAEVLTTGEMTVAPVFEHGAGLHVDSVIVSRNKKPPTWSEAAAREVVIDELKRHGLEFTLEGDMPRVSGILSTRDGNAATKQESQAGPITLTFDGVSREGRIAFEVLTTEDIPVITDNTDDILNLLGAAKKLVAELSTKPGGYTVGVFYDPMQGDGVKPSEEPLRQQARDFAAWLNETDRNH